MKKNKLVFFLFLAGLLIFSGCSKIGIGGDDIKTDSLFGSGTSSKGGSGVTLSFAEGNPPKDMIKGQPVTFAFIFTNFQEHEITDMVLRTRGFDRGYVVGLNEDYSINNIPRATSQTGPGVFSGHIVSGVRVDGFSGNYNLNPGFDYCYSAKTSFREQVCVPSNRNQCDVKIDKSSAQNGPLNVRIDRIMSVENNVRIDFTINNNGNGKVVNECFNIEDYANKYDLSASLGSSSGNCNTVSGQNIIGGKSNFYCEFPRSGSDSYASQVTVELNYKYLQSVQKNIIVKDLNQGYQ